MAKIRCYISHSIRGKYGKDATKQQMEANNNRAIEFGNYIKKEFPSVDFYIPGEHDEFILEAYLAKYLTEKQILDIDCKILSKCSFMILFMPDSYISGGMQVELDHANASSIPHVKVHSTNLNYVHKKIINGFLEKTDKNKLYNLFELGPPFQMDWDSETYSVICEKITYTKDKSENSQRPVMITVVEGTDL